MFCTNCGTKSVEKAKFCASCGSALGQPEVSKKSVASRTIESDSDASRSNLANVASEPVSVESSAKSSEVAKVSGFAKLLANKPLAIALAAGAVLALAGSVFLLSPKGPTQDTAKNFMITAASLDFDAEDVREVDFDKQILTGCRYKKELDKLFLSGTTWAEGGIKSKSGASSAFHIDQRIFEADSEEDARRIAELLTLAGGVDDCSSRSESSLLQYSFDYTNPRTISDAFGLNVEGAVIDTDTLVCVSSCSVTNGQIIVANRGKVTVLLQYRGSNEYGIGFNDLQAVVTETLAKFAG